MYKPTRLEIFTMAALTGVCADPGCNSDRKWMAAFAVDVAKNTLLELDKVQQPVHIEKEMD